VLGGGRGGRALRLAAHPGGAPALTRALDEIEAQALPLIDDLAQSLEEANAELARVDRLVGSAESISATVDATSKLAYRALSAPVIKTVAVTSGASRAARRIRRER
jgi:hypothetical protein